MLMEDAHRPMSHKLVTYIGICWFELQRPCYMQNNANGEEYPTVEECSACTIGPETIKVNGTEYTARFCNKTAEFQMLVANPPWVRVLSFFTHKFGFFFGNSEMYLCLFEVLG